MNTAAVRVTKAEARYDQPAADQTRRCDLCSMFSPRRVVDSKLVDGCTLVAGFIRRDGTCRFWERK